jgi:ABC-type oligopeptide transport system substrate-binding subunit
MKRNWEKTFVNAQLFKIGIIMMTLTNLCNTATAGDAGSETIKIHFPKVQIILDPLRYEDAFSMDVILQLYRGLLRFTPEGEVVTDLAKSWKESKDHLHYTFKLKDAVFSDGSKITAKNVQMSFARIFYLTAGIGADLDYISGAKEFKKLGDLARFGVHAISDSEVEFVLSHPSALFLKHLAVVDCAILPLTDYKNDFKVTVKSGFSGPYKLIRPPTESSIELEKWRTDVLDSPKPPKMISMALTDEAADVLARDHKTDSLDHDIIDAKSIEDFEAKGWKKPQQK